MKIYAGVTDQDWFDFLRSQSGIDEVNFWQPSPNAEFRALRRGDLFLFKLHRSERTGNRDLIAGGGVFLYFTVFPSRYAWDNFGERNGASSYSELRMRLIRLRRIQDNPREDFPIGCIILTQPFFFDESLWFPIPDWSPSIVRGKAKGYELDKEAGQQIWKNLHHAWQYQQVHDLDREALRIDEERARYGKETSIQPRLGQGSFRLQVTDAYRRACAITEEHSLPALEAAHIKPYDESGPHAVNNGLLLRSDLHRLFDRGYITITPEYRIEVSRRLIDEFRNGRSYNHFHGKHLPNIPACPNDRPLKDMLIWHNEHIYRN